MFFFLDIDHSFINLTDCDTHGFQFDGETSTCIKLISTSGSTWKEARTLCQQEGGDLVIIVSKKKMGLCI